jgi:hypothetical protein
MPELDGQYQRLFQKEERLKLEAEATKTSEAN